MVRRMITGYKRQCCSRLPEAKLRQGVNHLASPVDQSDAGSAGIFLRWTNQPLRWGSAVAGRLKRLVAPSHLQSPLLLARVPAAAGGALRVS
eukprot:759644-Pyramimonas_sp.AAC.1